MRGQHDVGQTDQRVVGGDGLALENVQPSPGDAPAPKGLDQGVLVDQPAAASVDEDGGRLHQAERPAVDEVVGRGVERRVDGDDVARRQEGVEVDHGHPGRARATRVGPDHLEAERPGAVTHGRPDTAEPDHAEALTRRPPNTTGEAEVPGPALDPSIEGDDPAGQGQDQPEGVVGHFVSAVVGDVDDRDTECRRRRQVDRIEAHTVAPDDATGRERPEHVAGDRGVLDDEADGGRLGRGRDHILGGPADEPARRSARHPRGCPARP